jgi:hypothetical protein
MRIVKDATIVSATVWVYSPTVAWGRACASVRTTLCLLPRTAGPDSRFSAATRNRCAAILTVVRPGCDGNRPHADEHPGLYALAGDLPQSQNRKYQTCLPSDALAVRRGLLHSCSSRCDYESPRAAAAAGGNNGGRLLQAACGGFSCDGHMGGRADAPLLANRIPVALGFCGTDCTTLVGADARYRPDSRNMVCPGGIQKAATSRPALSASPADHRRDPCHVAMAAGKSYSFPKTTATTLAEVGATLSFSRIAERPTAQIPLHSQKCRELWRGGPGGGMGRGSSGSQHCNSSSVLHLSGDLPGSGAGGRATQASLLSVRQWRCERPAEDASPRQVKRSRLSSPAARASRAGGSFRWRT